MIVKTELLPVAFRTNERVGTPDKIELQFTQEDIDKLRRAIAVCNAEGFHSVNVEFEATQYYNSEDCEPDTESDYVSGHSRIIVFQNGDLYFLSEMNERAEIQIESCAFYIPETIQNTTT